MPQLQQRRCGTTTVASAEPGERVIPGATVPRSDTNGSKRARVASPGPGVPVERKPVVPADGKLPSPEQPMKPVDIESPKNGLTRGGIVKDEKQLTLFGVPMKWISLVALTAQTSAQVFVIKWARNGSIQNGGPPYLASTIVLFTELLKMTVSLILVAIEMGSAGAAGRAVLDQCRHNRLELLKISVPSLLYTVQNNLMFFSLLKLTAAVQQVTYQLKILTTALLSVVMLGKVLGTTKWIALFILLAGVVLVQWTGPGRSSSRGSAAELGGPGAILDSDKLMGFSAVLVACLTSGFASVYLEKLLKQADASIWMRNVQLGVFGTLMALVVAWTQDGDRILQHGLTQGYNYRVACVICTNALGGLLCAAVLKYADNILRCFSTALSIILTCLLSASVLREYEPDMHFIVGTFLAIVSTFLYSLGIPPQIRQAWLAHMPESCLDKQSRQENE